MIHTCTYRKKETYRATTTTQLMDVGRLEDRCMNELGWSLSRVANSSREEMQHAFDKTVNSSGTNNLMCTMKEPMFPATPLRSLPSSTMKSTEVVPSPMLNENTNQLNLLKCMLQRLEKQKALLNSQSLSPVDCEFVRVRLLKEQDMYQKEVLLYQKKLLAQQESKQLLYDTYQDLSNLSKETHDRWSKQDQVSIRTLKNDLEILQEEYDRFSQKHTYSINTVDDTKR